MKYGYARVSKSDQNADLQVAALKEAGCDKIIVEKVSGASSKRPKLEDLIGELEENDTLAVWRLDRLARNVDDLRAKVLWLGDEGINFLSLNESIDTTTANGKLIFNVFSAVIGFERDLLIERTRAGVQQARERGARLGRPPALSPEQISHAWKLVNGGEQVKSVASTFGVDKTTLYRAMKKSPPPKA